MSTAMPPPADVPRLGHKRVKSSSVLKAIIGDKTHKRTPSEGAALSSNQPLRAQRDHDATSSSNACILPADHPHNQSRVLGELPVNNNAAVSPRKSRDAGDGSSRPAHKKTLSSVSLRSLGREKDNAGQERSPKKSTREQDRSELSPTKPKKTKSTTNLAATFLRSRSSKTIDTSMAPKDKENTTPPSSAGGDGGAPIWAEYSSQKYQEKSKTTTVPLNDRDEVSSGKDYNAPSNRSPAKQRILEERPTLQKRHQSDQRPKSTPAWGLDSVSVAGPASRPLSAGRTLEQNSRVSQKQNMIIASSEADKATRVKAAVAEFNSRAQEAAVDGLDPKGIEAAFEAVLDSRNIPESMRPKMRSLTLAVKADFIKQHQAEHQRKRTSTTSVRSDAPSQQSSVNKAEAPPNSVSGTTEELLPNTVEDPESPTKRSRPRSRTFTWSKSGSPSKKHRAEASDASTVTQGENVPSSTSSKSLSALSSNNAPSLFRKAPKPAVPDDFVNYLRKVQRPQEVEVGRLHKLRLLLRNETVSWVDAFIQLGGMGEIIALLHRIMAVEWREEHEDTLLHEALLCLRGLCTTDLALQKLKDAEDEVFPPLLAMLFDDEHKGPSEFNTRGIVMNLLFIYLSSAPPTAQGRADRARKCLAYLANVEAPEDKRPVDFILTMKRSRPYTTWCREITNVTKEVFWIFLHNLNVISTDKQPASETETSKSENSTKTTASDTVKQSSYTQRHFPLPRPPVPAAPYVGGVEWDATQYLAIHLDVLNGCLASLPSVTERNTLRSDLRASGLEKVMGCTLRTCKDKFYDHVHDGLRTWIRAAGEDGWETRDVRQGPDGNGVPSPLKCNPKKGANDAPKLDLPKLDFAVERATGNDAFGGAGGGDGGWL